MIKLGSKLRLYTTTSQKDDQFLLEVEQIALNKNTWTSTIEIRGYILDYTMNVDSEALSYEVEVYMGTKSATSYTRGDTVFQYQKDKGINWISREGMNIGQPLYEHTRCHFFTHQFTVKHPHTTYNTNTRFAILLDVQAHRHDALANYDYRFNSTYGYGDDGTYTHTPQWLNVSANLLEEDESYSWSLKPEFPFTYYDEPINILYKHDELTRQDMFGVLKYQYSNTEIEIKRITYDEYITVQGVHSFEWTPSSNIAASFFASNEYVKDISLVLEIYQTSVSYPNGNLFRTYQTPLKIFQSASVERPGGVMSIFGSATFEKYNPKTEGNNYARFIDDVLITLTANCYHGDATPYVGFIRNGGFIYMIDFANGETSKVIMDIPDDLFNFTVIDTLGRRGEAFDYLPGTFYEYLYPTASISETVLSGNTGTLTFTVEGGMYLGVYDRSGLKNNLRYASYGVYDSEDLYTPIVWKSVWGYEEEMNPTYGDNTYSFTIEVPNLNYMRSYVVVVSVSDKFNTVTTEKARAKLDPIFDWGKDDFRFNVVVNAEKGINLPTGQTISGNGTEMLSQNEIGDINIGLGSYNTETGATKIYGQQVDLISNDVITLNGRGYGEQKVLWEGSVFMHEGHTITLPEAISDQPSGIILVFSLFRNGAAEDVSINSFFVSKKEVELLPGAPHMFIMGINAGFSSLAGKYIYINDDSLTGHEGNDDTGSSVISFTNSNYVLRYVIGV